MNISISKTHIIGIVLLVAMGVMMFGSGAWGQADSVTECTVRGTLEDTEIRELIGLAEGADITDIRSDIDDGKLSLDTNSASVVCLYSAIKWISGIVAYLVLALSTLMILYAGYLYVRSRDNTEQQSTARSILVAAIIGYVITILAFVAPGIIRSFL